MATNDDVSLQKILQTIDGLQSRLGSVDSYFERRLSHYFSMGRPIVDPSCHRVLMHSKDGQRVYLDARDPFISVHMLETQHWEPHVRSALRLLLGPGSTYVDVGANIGLHLLFAYSIVGKGGRIIAIEPNPSTLEVLRLNVEINALWDVTSVFEAAASNLDGSEASFECWPRYSGMSGFRSDKRERSRTRNFPTMRPESISVKTRTVDSILKECGNLKPDLVKIDVEGFESVVLEGCVEVIKSHRDVSFLVENPTAAVGRFFKMFQFEAYRTNEGFEKVDLTYFDRPKGGDYIFFNPLGRHAVPLADFVGRPFHDSRDTSVGHERDLAHGRKAFVEAIEVIKDLQKEILLRVAQRDTLARRLALVKSDTLAGRLLRIVGRYRKY